MACVFFPFSFLCCHPFLLILSLSHKGDTHNEVGFHMGHISAILIKPSFLYECKSPLGYHSWVLLLVSPWRWFLGSGGYLPFHLIEWGPCLSLRLLAHLLSVFHLHCTYNLHTPSSKRTHQPASSLPVLADDCHSEARTGAVSPSTTAITTYHGLFHGLFQLTSMCPAGSTLPFLGPQSTLASCVQGKRTNLSTVASSHHSSAKPCRLKPYLFEAIFPGIKSTFHRLSHEWLQ